MPVFAYKALDRQGKPADGTLPPLNPVPEPRVTTGTRAPDAYLMTALTSSVVFGKTTHAGSW